MAKKRRFTIYDKMEEDGVFDNNPANAQSPDYRGPVEYPKMLYHPDGKTRITVPAEIIITPMGPKAVGEKRELLNLVVYTTEEELEAIENGWHLHPSQAMACNPTEFGNAYDPQAELDALSAEEKRLQARKQAAQAAVLKNQRQEDARSRSLPVPTRPMASPQPPKPVA